MTQVSYGGAHDRTPTAHNSVKPNWDALFSFHVFDLRVRVQLIGHL